jgi:hypothetical protein
LQGFQPADLYQQLGNCVLWQWPTGSCSLLRRGTLLPFLVLVLLLVLPLLLVVLLLALLS